MDDPRQIEAWNTANVARVYLVRAPELPMVDVRVAFDAGSARNRGKGARVIDPPPPST